MLGGVRTSAGGSGASAAPRLSSGRDMWENQPADQQKEREPRVVTTKHGKTKEIVRQAAARKQQANSALLQPGSG